MTIRALALAGVALAVLSAEAQGQYTDSPTSDWYKSLASPFTAFCCDQADCKRAESDWRDGSWWAKSNRTQEWVRIPDDRITKQLSIFNVGVLCEGDPDLQASPTVHYVPRIYCFAPPDLGF